jgi:hypothetical protein
MSYPIINYGVPPDGTTDTGGDTSNGGIDWTTIVTGAEGTLATIFGPHYPTLTQPGGGIRATATPGGISGGISTNTLILIALVAAVFVLGKKGR